MERIRRTREQMVEGRCRYSLQWRVSGRLKEQGELNNAQYMYWEKYVSMVYWLLRQHFIKQCFKTKVSVDVLRFLMWTGLKKSFKTLLFLHTALKTWIFALFFLFVVARSVLRLYALVASRNHAASLFLSLSRILDEQCKLISVEKFSSVQFQLF